MHIFDDFQNIVIWGTMISFFFSAVARTLESDRGLD
jgi:hypothetical protein